MGRGRIKKSLREQPSIASARNTGSVESGMHTRLEGDRKGIGEGEGRPKASVQRCAQRRKMSETESVMPSSTKRQVDDTGLSARCSQYRQLKIEGKKPFLCGMWYPRYGFWNILTFGPSLACSATLLAQFAMDLTGEHFRNCHIKKFPP